MKPRMRAFSGRVTLLAVLNISCAANICSLCSAGRGVSAWLAAQVLLPSTCRPCQAPLAPPLPGIPTVRDRFFLGCCWAGG